MLTQVNLDGFALPVKQLKGTEPVESLDFSSQGLGVASAIVIANLIGDNTSLTDLDLSSTDLKDQGCIIVCDSLRDSKVSKLANLNLGDNEIGVSGAKSAAAYVAVTTSLTSVDLSWNELGADEQQLVGDAVAGKVGFDLKL